MNDSIKRSVDSLQKIYAVIVGLAITKTLQRVFENDDNGEFNWESFYDYLPALIAFMALVVPFYHGMNRHLDKCYLENAPLKKKAIIIDFFVFCFEAGILFIFSYFIKHKLDAFIILGILLFVDMIWSIISHIIHYSSIQEGSMVWAIINGSTLVAGFFIYVFQNVIFNDMAAWCFCVLSIVRTILDYSLAKKFYFPNS